VINEADYQHKLKQIHGLLDAYPAEAEKLCNELLEDKPEDGNATLCKGLTYLKGGEPLKAGEFFMSQAQCPGSDRPEFYVNAASAFQHAGEEEKEWEALTKLLAHPVSPGYESSYRRIADWANDKESWLVARKAFRILFEINSDDFNTSYTLARVCSELKAYKEALTYYLKSMELIEDEKQVAAIHSALAGIYKDLGMQAAGYTHFRTAYEKTPSSSTGSNLIMHMQYMHGVTLKEFYDQCREYSARFLRAKRRFQHPLKRLDANKAQSGLRIGFVSGDFVAHSLSNLMLEPIRRLKALGPQHIFTCYSSREKEREDSWSEKYKESVDFWHNVHGLSDQEVAELINEEQIDILVDLAGHTAYNRLPVFGYKPAPVQAGWISGMMTPPAIETINYFFTDQWMKPPVADDVCMEKLIELPAAYSYFPMTTPPDIKPLPADKKGHITFGSLNNPCKISRPVLELWAATMKAVPRSKISIKVYGIDHERTILRDMMSLGIAKDRVDFIYQLPSNEDVMRFYTNNIDIVLDTFPCAGCLTSAEAMWMGVPVMTLVGGTFLHRQTWTLISQLGWHEELGAEDPEQFVERTKALATNRKRLREIRNTLREQMDMALVRNPEAIAEGLVRGFEAIWVDWCESRKPLERLALYV